MIDYGMQTNVGTRHNVNEDAVGHDLQRRLWLVADGMGGHAAGDVASAIVRDCVQREVAAGAPLCQAIDVAHREVAASARADARRQGMGSTVVAVQLNGKAADVAWVGDSRAYLLRGGHIRMLTHDHTLVQWLLDRGDITAEEAVDFPRRNVLTRTLGLEHPVVDEARTSIRRGDLLLLCSDGVTRELTQQEIREIVLAESSPQAAADALIAAVSARRGKDDASAIVIRVLEQDKLGVSAWLPVIGGVAIGVLAFLIWNWIKTP